MAYPANNQVLLVHNDSEEVAQLQELFAHEGCATQSTWSGLEALSLLAKTHFDVLLLDSYVPDLYVGELIERVSRLPLPPRVFVLEDLPRSAGLLPYEEAGLCGILRKEPLDALARAVAALTENGKGGGRCRLQ